jgi:hypothetical protein
MGALIPIGRGGDAEIKDKLNKTFSGENLTALQNNTSGENLFDDQHHLHRVAYRLGCYPIEQHSGEKSRQKWFYFLKYTLPNSRENGRLTSDAIKHLLLYALDPSNKIKRVVFEAIEDTTTNVHYIDPDNWTPQVVDRTLKILLRCPAPLDPANTAPMPDQPGDADAGEKPLPL